VNNNKYNNIPLWYDPVKGTFSLEKQNDSDWYFPSMWEYQVYEELLKWLPKEMIKRQHPLILKPKTMAYPEINWKVDFAIFNREKPLMYVEAKGMITREFKTTLKILEYVNPQAWDILTVVHKHLPVKLDCTSKQTVQLTDLRHEIDRLVPMF
jgi:hypothetical protein